MTDQIASLVVEVDASGAKKAAVDLDSLTKAADRADTAANDLEGSTRKLSTAEKAVADEARRAMGAFNGLADEQEAAARTAQRLNQVHGSAVVSSKALNQATLNLGRQFADVGTSLAGGASPFMVFVQQAPQILDIFSELKARGISTGAAFRAMGASLAPAAVAIGAIAAVAGVAFGAAGLAARELNKDNKNLAAGLGLTEKQMERLKDKGVETGVTIGDVFKGTFNYLKGAAAPAIAPMIKWFGELFDKIADGSVMAVKAIVGGFAGAFAGVKAIWSDLPAVLGDLFASGANLAISAIEKLLNFATAGINSLIEKANAVSAKVNGPQLGTLGGFKLDRVNNANEGAASRTAANAAAAVADAYEKAGKGVDKVFADIGKSIVKAAEERIKKAAGDAAKTPKGKADARDMNDERTAQIQAQIEQALGEELRARLGVTKEISARSEIERQIVSATVATRQAQINAQIAGVKDDKGLNDAKKTALIAELERLKAIQASVGALQRQAISDRERADLAAEVLATAQAGYQSQIDILRSQMGLARSSYEASRIERQILEKRYASEAAVLQSTAANAMLKESERQIARDRLVTLGQIHANELKQLDLSDNMVTALTSAVNAIDRTARAFKSGDIGAGISGLSKSLSEASGILSGIKGLGGLGGKLGGIADFLGPIGGLVSGVTSLFGGLFGGSSKKKAEKRAAEEAARQAEAERQQTIADTGRALEITLLRAQGKELEAVAKEREAELAKLSALSPALAAQQQAVYAALDLAEEQAKAAKLAADQRSLDIQLLEVMGRSEEALAMKRADVLATTDPLLRATQAQIFAEEDLAKKRAAEAQEAAARAAKQAEIVNAQASVQDRIDAITKTSAELLYLGREKELKAADALDASLGPMLLKLWEFEDAATKTAEATAKAAEEFERLQTNQTTNIGLMRQLMAMDDAVLGTTSARDAARRDVLAGLDDQGKYIQGIVWAREDEAEVIAKQAKAIGEARDNLTRSYEREKSAIEATRDKFEGLAKTLRDFGGSLSDELVSALDPISKRDATSRAFFDAANRAALGDFDAASLLPKLGEAFKTASEAAASDQLAYLRDLTSIKSATDRAADTAERQVSAADRQLEVLNQQVAGLISIDQSVDNVALAIEKLALAQASIKPNAAAGAGMASAAASLTAAQIAANGNAAFAYGLANSMLGQALAGSNDPAVTAITNAAKGYSPSGLPGFAEGGSFMIGGNAGIDQNILSINGQPAARVGMGELVTVTPPGRGGGDNSAAISRLEARLANMEAALISIATSNNSMDRREQRAEVDGYYVRGEAPGEAVQTEAA